MGEIADMMLDGTLCESCGEFIGEGSGFPRCCNACSGPPAPRRDGRVKKRRKERK